MVQFRNCVRRLPESRRWSQRILFSLLLGSLFGAFWGRFLIRIPTTYGLEALREVAFSRCFFRDALFPCLLAMVLVLRGRFLFCLLFFIKGAAVSLTLCAAAAAGTEWLLAVLPPLILETLLPLPVLVFIGAVWAEQAETGTASLWLLIPGLLTGLVGALLRTTFF